MNKTIHTFWAGGSMPSAYYEYRNRWRDWNPDWTVCTWGIDTVHFFPKVQGVLRALLAKPRTPEIMAQVSQVVGYATVEQFGGVYIKLGIEPVRSINEGEFPSSSFVAWDHSRNLPLDVFGAPSPSQPYWMKVITALPEYYNKRTLAQLAWDKVIQNPSEVELPHFSNLYKDHTVLG